MVAPIHKNTVKAVISLFFSDVQHRTWLLPLGRPFSEVKRLDDDTPTGKMLRAQWDASVDGIRAIQNPLATVFVLGTNIEDRQTRIIAGFDVSTEANPSVDGYTWISQYTEPNVLTNYVYDILNEMGAIP